jgi:hypothetical protein
MAQENHAAASAAKKLDELFAKLNPEEQVVISQMVRASLIQAAESFSHGVQASVVPDYVTGITGQHAPSLVKSLRFPGSLAAHSIPGCNSAALEVIRKEAGTQKG